uniref:Uncharacterized protein n=1 Tax=Chromera velia CCMP2878 TaxID=1169474 RepID=A0A0G4F2P2_9ALVE|eukprot:Cvel_14921.t1-p1 / transcript=Cvel_14921.t1 / gene=Cvel_14921 / organism=Chromera_velia_CCMP2878 / gene_product=hypothetical protein / transcript_product=hypothetical protein / location=Cvel_scaffold1081:19847-21505(+) / protein_length=553 / sequence_SO=supercontig / SO=protein_coding / is_pseudo=false
MEEERREEDEPMDGGGEGMGGEGGAAPMEVDAEAQEGGGEGQPLVPLEDVAPVHVEGEGQERGEGGEGEGGGGGEEDGEGVGFALMEPINQQQARARGGARVGAGKKVGSKTRCFVEEKVDAGKIERNLGFYVGEDGDEDCARGVSLLLHLHQMMQNRAWRGKGDVENSSWSPNFQKRVSGGEGEGNQQKRVKLDTLRRTRQLHIALLFLVGEVEETRKLQRKWTTKKRKRGGENGENDGVGEDDEEDGDGDEGVYSLDGKDLDEWTGYKAHNICSLCTENLDGLRTEEKPKFFCPTQCEGPAQGPPPLTEANRRALPWFPIDRGHELFEKCHCEERGEGEPHSQKCVRKVKADAAKEGFTHCPVFPRGQKMEKVGLDCLHGAGMRSQEKTMEEVRATKWGLAVRDGCIKVPEGAKHKKLREALNKNKDHLKEITKEKEEETEEAEDRQADARANTQNAPYVPLMDEEEEGVVQRAYEPTVEGVTQTANALFPLVEEFCKTKEVLASNGEGGGDCGCGRGEECHVKHLLALEKYLEGRSCEMRFCPIKNSKGE